MPAARHLLAVFRPRSGGQGDDGRCPPAAPPLPDRLHDLETVDFRHVQVQQQHIEIRSRGAFDS